MKKIEILSICCLCVCLLGACEELDFDKKESNPFSSLTKKSEDLNYQKACEELDFEKAHQILGKLRDVFISEGLPEAWHDRLSDIKGYNEYVDADVYIFREEATYLIGLDDPSAENRTFKLIMETPLDGTPREEGHISYSSACENDDEGNKNWLYCYCIKRNNQKCDIVMDLAILHGNQSLAKKVLMYYKDNMYIQTGSGYREDGDAKRINVKGETVEVAHDEGYVWYDSTDKDAAQKRYDEAVKNGVFQK